MRIIFVLCCFFSIQLCAKETCDPDKMLTGITQFTSPVEIVISSPKRVFFYSSANNRCRMKNKFVINGDKLISFYKTDGFIYVNYLNKEGKIIDGWIMNNSFTNANNNINNNDFKISYKNGHLLDIGSVDRVFVLWARSNKIDIADPILSGIDENSWSIPFSGGFAELDEPGAIIKRRIMYSYNRNDYETYLSELSITSKDFKTSRGISVGDSWGDVERKYGPPGYIRDHCVSYVFFNKKITFCEIDNLVSSIKISDLINK